MSAEYVGNVILYLGANEAEVTKIDAKDNTDGKPVKTMSHIRRVKGFTRGVGQYDVAFTAVVPTDGTAVDWAKIDDAKIGLVPGVKGARLTSYLGFCAAEAGDSYTVDNELVVDTIGFVIRKVLE